MNSEGYRTPQRAHSIGETALGILSNPHHGTVLARVTGAVYLCSELGELFWLTPPGTAMHQRCIQVAALPQVTTGSEYHVTAHTLKTNAGNLVIFEGARVWRATVITPERIIPLDESYAQLVNVVNQLLKINTPTGFGQFIPAIITNCQIPFLEMKQQGTMAEKAWSLVKDIAQGFTENNSERLINSATSLIGYGEGLTPAGDDFLGGLLFSVLFLNQYHPHVLRIPLSTYSDLILRSNSLTNLISYTILKDHANGHSVEPLHQLSTCILMGEPVEQSYHSAEKLISIGHSTGWDLLAGFLAGMSSTTHNNGPTL